MRLLPDIGRHANAVGGARANANAELAAGYGRDPVFARAAKSSADCSQGLAGETVTPLKPDALGGVRPSILTDLWASPAAVA